MYRSDALSPELNEFEEFFGPSVLEPVLEPVPTEELPPPVSILTLREKLVILSIVLGSIVTWLLIIFWVVSLPYDLKLHSVVPYFLNKI